LCAAEQAEESRYIAIRQTRAAIANRNFQSIVQLLCQQDDFAAGWVYLAAFSSKLQS